MKATFLIGLPLCYLLATPAVADRPPATQISKHSSLPARTQAQMAASIGRGNPEFHVQAHRGGYRFAGAESNVTGEFMLDGVTFQHRDSSWAMTLRGIGYGEKVQPLEKSRPHGRENRVEYRRGYVTEWYMNGPLGIEQGFTIQKAPGKSDRKPLALTMELSGNVTAALDSEGQGLVLQRNGHPVLRYSGLVAWDARGRTLRSWLDLSGDRLRLQVDDAGAAYPITVDPYIQAARLTTAKLCSTGTVCDDGSAHSQFGWSVAVSGDGNVAVVGAVRAAYVFLKPPAIAGGWSSTQPIYYVTKLQPSAQIPETANFGRSVAIDMTGSTIAVGSPAGSLRSAVFMFLKPETGWGNPAVQIQIATLTSSIPASLENDLGFSVAITPDGSAVAAGAPTTSITKYQQGAIYYFERHPSLGWVSKNQTQLIQSVYAGQLERMGISVSMSDDSFLILGGTQAKVARMFNRYSQDLVTLTTAIPNGAKFGAAVALSGDGSTAAVSASGCQTSNSCEGLGNNTSAIYVYQRNGSSWNSFDPRTEDAKLVSSVSPTTDLLGSTLAISTDGAIIAAATPTMNAGGTVNVFVRPSGGWVNGVETTRFDVPDKAYTVSMTTDGSTILAGSPFTNVGQNVNQGVSYVFTGSATTPNAKVSPASLNFGSHVIGTISVAQTVTLTNTGTAPLAVTGVAVTQSFSSTTNCLIASPLAPGSSCSETVAFRPMAAGAQSGTLTFTNNSGGTAGTTQVVALTGIGVKAGTTTTITSVTSGQLIAGQPVSIGFAVAPQVSTTFVPSGTVTVAASTGENCSASVSSGSCAISFSTAGTRTVVATYAGDAYFAGSTSAARSVGIVDFTLSVSPAVQTIKGRKATYTVTVTPQNGFTGTVSLGCSGGPANTTCAMAPASVTLSGAAVGSKATLTLPVNAGAGTYNVTMTGQFGIVTRSSTATLIVQ